MDTLHEDDVEVVSGITSEVVKEVLIPEIEKEVNEGESQQPGLVSSLKGLQKDYNQIKGGL